MKQESQLYFMQGQCFNFAYAMCQLLQSCPNVARPLLATATGSRERYEDTDFVCIHCLVKTYHVRQARFICLDASGIHPENHLESIAEDWLDVELEMNEASGDICIHEYDFYNESRLYWNDLRETGAEMDPCSISAAKQYISGNLGLFSDVFLPLK